MIDIDKLLEETDTVLKIELQGDAGQALPTFVLKRPDAVALQKLHRQYYRPKLSMTGGGARGLEQQVEMDTDEIGYALAMIPYITGWEGVRGDFSRHKAETLFKRFAVIAIAFARGVQRFFEELEKQDLEKAQVLEKN
jgi:hypothetical protein